MPPPPDRVGSEQIDEDVPPEVSVASLERVLPEVATHASGRAAAGPVPNAGRVAPQAVTTTTQGAGRPRPGDRPVRRRPGRRALLRQVLSSPASARHGLVLSEVLGPPVSLRVGPKDHLG